MKFSRNWLVCVQWVYLVRNPSDDKGSHDATYMVLGHVCGEDHPAKVKYDNTDDIQLSHWGRDKMGAISQTKLSKAFSWMKISEFRLKFHWSLLLWVRLTILVQIMVWRRPGDKPLSEPMMFRLSTHTHVTRPQWVKAKRSKTSENYITFVTANEHN